jgi:hypothetical protein
MKKISSKIIISLLLAIFLFSGVNFDLEKKGISRIVGVEKADAASWGEWWIAGAGSTPGVSQAISLWNLIQPNHQIPTVGSVAGGQVIEGVIKTVMMVNGALLQLIAIPLASMLFRLAANMLDWAVTITLSTQIFRNTSSGVAIIWSLIRDLCNITFIFILLWISIQTIIGVAGGKTKKVLADVVIAALLINFSLFITRIVIDAGNILAINLYDQIHTGETVKGVSYVGKGLGEILMQSMGMSGIMGASKTAAGSSPTGVWSVQYGMVSYLQLITLLIAFITFVYAMLLMVVRIVTLIFLAALSPIGFMGNALPKFAEYSKQWRETLYGQVMIAPIFLLFVYLILRVSSAFNPIPETGPVSLTNAPNNAASYQAYFKYIMVIVLLIAAVKVTKKMSGAIGTAVEKFGGMAIGVALGAATGGAALAMRQTLGRVAANKLNDEGADLKARAAKGDTRARIRLARLEKQANSSYDLRNTPVAGLTGKAFGAVGDQLGIKMPKTGKPSAWASSVGLGGTVAEARKAQQEKENKIYNELNASVTNKQKLAASSVVAERNEKVQTMLDGDTAYIDPKTGLKARKEALTKIDTSTHKAFVKINDDEKAAVDAEAEAIKDLNDLKAIVLDPKATESEKSQHIANIAAARANADKAKKDVAAIARIKDSKVKELEGELKKTKAGEIAAIDEEIEKLKRKNQEIVEEDMSNNDTTGETRKKFDAINQARNYADSIRKSRVGTLSSIQGSARRKDLADRMENQRQS